MSYYKTYDFSKENFIEAFDAVYGRQAEEKAKKYAEKQEQNSVDQEISNAMKTHGLSRNEAICLLYPNG